MDKELDEQDDKRKELEVAEIMCGIQQKSGSNKQVSTIIAQSSDDIQQKAIDQHHQRQAEQITGATPYHLATKTDKDAELEGHVELVEMIEPERQLVQENYVYETAVPDPQSQSVTYTIQQHPSETNMVTKTEQFEGNQIIIMNENDTYEEIYASEPQDSQITYLDETGAEIGESNRPQPLSIKLESLGNNNHQQQQHLQQQHHQPVYIQTGASGTLPLPSRRKSILQVRQPQKIQIMDRDHSGTQFIQIQPQTNQTQLVQGYNQKNQPVLYYQTILLPPPTPHQQSQSSQIQVQNSNIIQIPPPSQHQQQQHQSSVQHQQPSQQVEKNKNSSNVIFLSPNGTIETQQPTYRVIQTNKSIEYVKVDSTNQRASTTENLIDMAVTQAGIKSDETNQDEMDGDDKTLVVKTEDVQSHHAYPSPFSQIPIADRTHQCKYCPKRFARADECKRHERIHTDTRPFACTYCPRRFTRKDHLRTHTRCHTKEKPYVCPICQRGFARSDERIRHIKTHVKKNECTMEEARKKLGNVQVGRRPTRNVNSTTSTTSTQNGQTTVTVSPVKSTTLTIHTSDEAQFDFTPKITIIAEDPDGTTTTTTPGNNNVS